MKKRYDLFFIVLWPIVASLFSFFLTLNNLFAIFLFLGIPSVYLSFKGRKYVRKVFLFALITSVPAMIAIDYIAELNGSWFFYDDTIFPFKIFNVVTIEVVLWAFLSIFFILMFYEYFVEEHKEQPRFYRARMKYYMSFVIFCFALFILFLYGGFSFNIPYFYLFWGIILLLLPFSIHALNYPKTTTKFFFVLAYFFYFNFIYEIAALKLNWWGFPGKEFIGWINLFGVSFPIEELLFWMILFVLSILSLFEYFDDDEK